MEFKLKIRFFFTCSCLIFIALSIPSYARRIKNFGDNIFNGTVVIGANSLILTHDYKEMSRATVELLIESIRDIVREKGEVVIGLPLGDTAKEIFKIIVTQYKDDPIWESVILVQSEEYLGVDPNSPQSCQYQLRNDLIDSLNCKSFISINGNVSDILEERERLEQEIIRAGGIDIMIRGIGRNGHLALNEPGFESDRLVDFVSLTDETKVSKGVDFSQALTLTLNSILDSKEVFIIAFGEDKQDATEKAILGEVSIQNQSSLLQRHGNVTYIIDQRAANEHLLDVAKEGLKNRIKDLLRGQDIKVFATDLDYTLSPLGERARDPVLNKLQMLTSHGIHIAVITGQGLERISMRLLDHLSSEFNWENLTAYANLGTQAYKFDNEGVSSQLYLEVEMTFEQIQLVNRAISEFKGEFSSEFKDVEWREGINGKVKVTVFFNDKVRTRETYEALAEFFEERLQGSDLKINGVGSFGDIDINIADKSYALIKLQEYLGVSPNQMIYIGDSFFGRIGNDIPAIKVVDYVFNVGSIDSVREGVFSLGIRGDWATEVLLDALLELFEE